MATLGLLGPNCTAEKLRSMPPGSPARQSISPGPASLILNPTGRKTDNYLLSFSESPLLCICIQKIIIIISVAKTIYLSMGRYPEQPASLETHTLNPVISRVLRSALAVPRTLMVGE